MVGETTTQRTNVQAPEPWVPPRPLPAKLQTARTIVRPWQASDATGMLEALDADRASYLPWLPWVAVDNQNVAECIYHIERSRREAVDGIDFTLGIFDRQTGDVIGGTGFHRMHRPSLHAEIGYWVRPERRGQGLCTEVVASILSWGFRPQNQDGWGFRRIDIFCAGSNKASQRVPQKIGLRAEVFRHKARWVNGYGWDDVLGWGVVSEEWDCATHALKRGPA